MQVGNTELLEDNFERRIRALEIATFGADGTKPLPYNTVQELQRHAPAAICVNDLPKFKAAEWARAGTEADRYVAALIAIITRANDGLAPGAAKVRDMKKLAKDALGW